MSLKKLLLSVIAATAAADTFYPEPALPLGWASQISESTVLGRDAANMVKVILSVREQNMDKIREIALDVSNPDSANYGQYLSQAQIDEITAPAAADVAAVRSWLNAEQFAGTVEEAQAGRTFVLTAPATAVGSLLKTTFRRVNNAATGQTTLRAASFVLPSAPGAAVTAVFGVHGLPLPPKRNLAAAASEGTPVIVTPAVIASTYNVGNLTVDRVAGKNRQAVVEIGELINKLDLEHFITDEFSNYQPGDYVVDKFVGDRGTGDRSGGEAILDIEYIMGVALGVKTEYWNFDDRDQHSFCFDLKNWTDILLATPDAPLVNSVSYGWQGNTTTDLGCHDGEVAAVDDNFVKLATKGITIIFASGDSGSGYIPQRFPATCNFKKNTVILGEIDIRTSARNSEECCKASFTKKLAGFTFTPNKGGNGGCDLYKVVKGYKKSPGSKEISGGAHSPPPPVLWASWPASSPWVTSVGATRFIGQKVSNEEMASDSFGSGGGFSRQFSRPAWQNDVVAAYLKDAPQLPPAGSFPPLGRGTPDVAALGEYFKIYINGGTDYESGTSASAPTFAGLVSLLNEARLKADKPPLGFLNPFLYKNPDAFFDVVKGTSAISRGNGPIKYGFNCTKGWDPVTGLGTPHFGKLLAAATAL